MPDLIIYLLKANLGICLFYLGYHFFLRRLTFYNLNRFYLLFSLFFSLLYPIFNFSFLLESNKQLPQQMVLVNWEEIVKATSAGFTAWDILITVFWIVVLLFVIRFIIGLFALLKIHRQSAPGSYSFYSYRKVFFTISPFSFWKNIYINPLQHTVRELEDILKHEHVHVEELHTADVLIVELISFVCWFNPFIWATKNAVKENLEFITDRQVLRTGIDKRLYQYSLVSVMTNADPQGIRSGFNLKSLKRRIFMMNKASSSKINFGKYVFIIPAVILFMLLFTITRAYEEAAKPSVLQVNSRLLNSVDTTLKTAINTAPLDQSAIKKENKEVKFNVSRKPVVQITLQNKEKPLYIINGEMLNSIPESISPDDIESISVLKDSSAIDAYGERGRNGVVVVTMKQNNISDQLKINFHNKAVLESKNNEEKPILKREPMYVVDGKENPLALSLLSPNSIESVEVIKGKDALLVPRSNGRDVVKIVTKKISSLTSSSLLSKPEAEKSLQNNR